MIFSVSNDRIQSTFDFSTDSVTIAVNDLDQNITISSQELPLAVWPLLLSQRQELLDNHLPWVPITSNQQGTFEKREELISSVGAQDLNTSNYQLTDLEDIDFNWESSQLDMEAVFRPGIETPFSPTTFDDLSMEGSVENPIVLDEEEDKENSAPTTTTPVSERPPETPWLLRSRAFEQERKMYPIMFTEYCFNNYYSVCVFDIIYK